MSRIDDGHSTTIEFQLYPQARFWEKTVTPFGWDGGDAVDTTTMRNSFARTFNARHLVTATEISITAAYNPEVLMIECVPGGPLLNVNGLIRIRFPNGYAIDFWGFLRTIEPDECTEGEQPTVTLTIQPSNQNAVGDETLPVVIGNIPAFNVPSAA